jgi:phosphoribosyl 1,2-cyclic phosphodiesterase
VLEYQQGGCRRACLIDLGISPRRTIKLLAMMGLGLHQIDDVLVTHLDTDHYLPSWGRWLPPHVRVRMHVSHARGQRGVQLPHDHLQPFEAPFYLQAGIAVRPLSLSHDDSGVTAFRFDLPESCGGGRLGFATDLGRVTRGLIDLLCDGGNEVDVLAIESNYCPRLQESSGRPYFLKQRIMGGRGHLSNEEALDAIHRVRPREHVVLLHLSRECNDPARVAELHAGADYALTIAEQDRPTRRVRIGGGAIPRPIKLCTPSLFEPMAP